MEGFGERLIHQITTNAHAVEEYKGILQTVQKEMVVHPILQLFIL